MNARTVLCLSLFLAACTAHPEQATGEKATEEGVFEMAVERLPDLNIPRSGHTLAYVGGELVAVGGHTTGFIPTATAEYFRDGKWHLAETFFPHDFGFGAVLPAGRLLTGGGCAEPFGIGQTWGVELYDAATHGFSPLPILDRKRGAHVSAARLSDGRIIVAGNWFTEDVISTYSPESGGTSLRAPSFSRAYPLILQTAPDNAFILSSISDRDSLLAPAADRLRGDPVEIPLLQEWTGWFLHDGQRMDQLFIGNEAVGGYAWLFPVRNLTDGRWGIGTLVGEAFSILETERSLPPAIPEGGTLAPDPILLADRERECAWLIGSVAGTGEIYAARVDYGEALRGGQAPVSLYHAQLPDGLLAPEHIWAELLPGGRIAFAGGLAKPDNYHPVATAFILHTELLPPGASFPWWTLLAGLLLAGGAAFLLLRKKGGATVPSPVQEVPAKRLEGASGADLMSRILYLMEKEELWRQKGLKVSDLATRLGTNATYISACINGQAGKSFPEFLGDYRLRHAQKLMRDHPDMRLAEVADESGFSNEQSFFRSFKARTGLTPGEWAGGDRS